MMNRPAPVHYTVLPARPEAHLFRLTCHISEPDPLGQRLSLPAWIPGSYMIRDFARNVIRLAASSEGRPLAVEKLDKRTWQCAPADGPLTIEYEVYAYDLSVRSAHFDHDHAYFNGTSLFLQVHGREAHPHTVELLPPPHADHWQVATALSRDGATEWGFGRYRATDYDDLIDHPVEMAAFRRIDFHAGGRPHHVIISGRHRVDGERLARDLERICETQIALFGELPDDIERYLFLVMAVGDGYGGLEHRRSCSLLCSREDLPFPGMRRITDGYRQFLGLCSHEYFHLWNVKRIKPAAFVPYDLAHESYTRQLWAFEGITAYYDDLILARSGVIPPESYLELLGQTITRVLRGHGRHLQSVAESSFDAWTRFYKQDESAPNTIVSYYTKGSLIALALDFTLRRESDGRVSLDDLMRRLWHDYGRTGQGVAEGEIERLAAELAGTDLGDFFARYLHGTEDPPLAELFERAGIRFGLRPARSADDKGGTPPPGDDTPPVSLGARLASDGAGVRLTHVFEGGAAQAAGLSAGDVIIAVDGLKVDRASLEKRLARHRPGETVAVHYFHRDELNHTTLDIREAPADTAWLIIDTDATPAQRVFRDAWLGNAGSDK